MRFREQAARAARASLQRELVSKLVAQVPLDLTNLGAVEQRLMAMILRENLKPPSFADAVALAMTVMRMRREILGVEGNSTDDRAQAEAIMRRVVLVETIDGTENAGGNGNEN